MCRPPTAARARLAVGKRGRFRLVEARPALLLLRAGHTGGGEWGAASRGDESVVSMSRKISKPPHDCQAFACPAWPRRHYNGRAMAEELNLDGSRLSIAVVVARFNEAIT